MASLSVANLPSHPSARPSPPRRSSSLCKDLISRLRPLPFQYVWSMWHSKSSDAYALNQIAEKIADIGAFYRVFNNFPWDRVKPKDGIHIFRTGVKPLWEDEQNLNGGCWTLKMRKEDGRPLKAWEELCLMICGGELQAEVAKERDHILGISFSPRLYWVHISIWTQDGNNQNSVHALQKTILSRLSQELQPKSESEYYYKRHSEHTGLENLRS